MYFRSKELSLKAENIMQSLFQESINTSILSVPLCTRCEAYLTHIRSKNFCERYVTTKSTYLSFAIEALELKDDIHERISLDRIIEIGGKWRQMRISNPKRVSQKPHFNTLTSSFLRTILEWLIFIDYIDIRYVDTTLIFNRIIEYPSFRLKYICAPIYAERLAYLNHLEQIGKSKITLKKVARYQLYIIEALSLVELRDIKESEIKDAIQIWNKHLSVFEDCRVLYSVAMNWFSYHNVLIRESSFNLITIENSNNTLEIDKHIHIESELLSIYAKHLLECRGLAYSTTISTIRTLQRFSIFVHAEELDLKSLNIDILDLYIKRLYDKGHSRRNIASTISTLKVFLRFAYTERWSDVDLSYYIKAPKVYSLSTIPSAPTWNNVKKLIAYYEGETPLQIRNRAIMIMFAVYGIRSSELRNLRVKDINWRDEQIYLYRAKGCKSQILPLMPIVGDALVRYITQVRVNNVDWKELFLDLKSPYAKISTHAIYDVVANAYKALDLNIELKHIGPHSLRHACASHLINSGHTINEVSNLLGHKKLDTTRTYAKINLDTLNRVADMNWEGML